LGTFLRHLFHLAFRAGTLGLFAVGVLDSSFLMLPLGNDFLLLGLSARHRAIWMIIMAVCGSAYSIYGWVKK